MTIPTATINQNQNGRFFFVKWNADMTKGYSSRRDYASAAYAKKAAQQSGYSVA